MKRICGDFDHCWSFSEFASHATFSSCCWKLASCVHQDVGDPASYSEVPHRSFCLSPERIRFHHASVFQPAGRGEVPVLLASCFLSVLSSLTITDILWHNRHHDPGDQQS